MTILKNKIKIIDPLPIIPNKKNLRLKILIFFLTILIILTIFLTIYNYLIPYINAVKLDKIIGKKTYLTDCNTKDFLIINSTKSYSMQLTNNDCEKEYYEGNFIIKNNNIIFNYETTINNKQTNKNIIGLIDINDNYNIIINNKNFESEKHE